MNQLIITPDAVLNCWIDDEYKTIREFLCDILKTLWKEGEGFSGKRPLGNSGWQRLLLVTLYENQIIDGEEDEYGDVEFSEENKRLGRQLIEQSIEFCFGL